PQPIDLLRWESHALDRELRENIHRVRNYKDVGFLPESCGLDAFENLNEKRDVAINQIQPRFFRLASQARRDQENVAICREGVVPCIYLVVPGKSAAVTKIERLPFRKVFIRVQNLNFGDQRPALQSVSRARTHTPPAANNRHFHAKIFLSKNLCP